MCRHIGVQLLDCREADIDIVFVDAIEIVHLCHIDRFPFKTDVLTEKVFCGAWVEEVVLCFLNNVGGVDEKEEVAIAFFIEVEDQTCHDKRLPLPVAILNSRWTGFSLLGRSLLK